jgi:hypothetical protein
MYPKISFRYLKFLVPVIFLLLLFGISTSRSDKKEIRFGVGAEGPRLNPRGLTSDGAKSRGAETPGYCPSYGGSIEYESIYDVNTILNPGGTMTIM